MHHLSQQGDFSRDVMNVLLFSQSFKQLGNKTQVFSSLFLQGGSQYRSRLTHSLEVAQISKWVAKTLGLNPELAEILGLLHDIGHAPYGHTGQTTLNHLLQPYGVSFEHNNQARRILEIIEPIDINPIVIEGLKKTAKHDLKTPYNYLESQIMNQCDRIAYLAADIEDSINMGFMHVEDYVSCKIFQHCEMTHQAMLDFLVQDLIQESQRQMANATETDIYQYAIIKHSPQVKQYVDELKITMKQKFFDAHPVLLQERAQNIEIMKKVFHALMNQKIALGSRYQQRVETGKCSLAQSVADYISGADEKYMNMLYMQSLVDF